MTPRHKCEDYDAFYKVVKNQRGFFNCIKAVCQMCGREKFVRHLRDFECTEIGTFRVEAVAVNV